MKQINPRSFGFRYKGSKRRFLTRIVPHLEHAIHASNVNAYIEPFCGSCVTGAALDTDKQRVFCDANRYLVALYAHVQAGGSLPDSISEAEYNAIRVSRDAYADYVVALAGFGVTFGAKFFGGYARDPEHPSRNYLKPWTYGVRQVVAANGARALYLNVDFKRLAFVSNAVVYLDPPYHGTGGYGTDFDPFDLHVLAHRWRDQGCAVFLSERVQYPGWAVVESIKVADTQKTCLESRNEVELLQVLK